MIIVVLSLSVSVAALVCPEGLRQICLDCDIDKKCQICKLGYYKVGGNCLACDQGCIDCRGQRQCLYCTAGYILKHGTCMACTVNCRSCKIEETYCTSCDDDYKLSSQNTCEYKYTLILFMVGFGLVIFSLTCIILVIKCCTTKKLGKPEKKDKYQSVLDRDILKRAAPDSVVITVDEIGKTCEQNDISVVGKSKGKGKGGSTLKSFLEADDGYDILTHISGQSAIMFPNVRKIAGQPSKSLQPKR